jgi:molybdopterin molybdotransferase
MLLSVDAALDRILSHVPQPTAESVPLREASGRVLAASVVAAHDQPPFNSSAMDGYAVRSADAHQGAVLRLVGYAQAGQGFQGSISTGECARVFTGAPVPEGADAVIMQEATDAEDDRITLLAAVSLGRNVRARGNDFAVGDAVLPAGTVLTPAAVSLVAATNTSHCSVARRPRMALISTGDELVAPGATLAPDQIVASNAFGLTSLFAPNCEAIKDWGIVADDTDALSAKLSAALAEKPDVLVTIGGASVGDHDYVQAVLRSLGVEIDFWRLAMRPGKPLMFGTFGETLVFGLPGNPVSALVTGKVIVQPALRAFVGLSPPRRLTLPLAEPLAANGPRRHFMRARLVNMANEVTGVAPLSETDSGHLTSLAAADCLIVQPEHDAGKQPGDVADVLLL